MDKILQLKPVEFENSSISASYSLVPLAELGQYLHSQRSLPGLPGAKLAGQVDSAEIDRLLLEKAEEQAIYIIELQKQIDELKTEVRQLKESSKKVQRR